MNERFAQMREQSVTVWQGMDRTRRIVVVTVSAAVLLGLLSLALLTGRTSYVPLYTNLGTGDAYEITEHLRAANIPYQLADRGTTVLVPQTARDELRLQLSSEGIPHSTGTGFELFDSQGFGVTEFTQQVNLRRALEGELARTFRAFDQVDYARVLLAIPEPQLYSRREQPVTASIALKLRPRATLTERQIMGIVNLAASAIEGLKRENVTVVDTAGNILYVHDDSEEFSTTRLTVSQLEMKTLYETTKQRSIESMLERVLGVGNAVVRVNADLNFDQIETSSEQFEPVDGHRGVLISEQWFEERQLAGDGEGGIPGTVTNVDDLDPTYQAIDEGRNVEFLSSEAIRNYETSRTVTNVRTAPGQIRRLTVSALVHSAGLNEGQIEGIIQTISMAAGIDEARGDEIFVHPMPFTPRFTDEELAAMETEAEREARQEAMRMYTRYGASLLLAILAVIFAFLVVRALRKKVYDDYITEEFLSQLETAGASDEGEEDQKEAGEPMTEDEKRQKQVREEVERIARDNPDEIAKMVKSWLTEE